MSDAVTKVDLCAWRNLEATGDMLWCRHACTLSDDTDMYSAPCVPAGTWRKLEATGDVPQARSFHVAAAADGCMWVYSGRGTGPALLCLNCSPVCLSPSVQLQWHLLRLRALRIESTHLCCAVRMML